MLQLDKKLDALKQKDRYRSLKRMSGIGLTSNDYLGLAGHPALKQAAINAIESGILTGSGGSRLLRGNHEAHEDLEHFAAEFFGCEKTLYFCSGFQANMALFGALPDRRDTIIFDSLIHASARDGIQACNAHHIRVPHNDLQAYEDALKKVDGQKWIAVESVYSMDGDLAPVPELLSLAEQYDAMLIVDEAHGSGIFGPHGKGVAEGLPHDRLITLHTCGKALGVAGGLICAREEIIDYMINAARPFIYSTAPMPLQAVLVKRALQLTQEEPERRDTLFALRDHANDILPAANSPSQIIPIILGNDRSAVETAAALQDAGFDIRAIRPPTVPEGTARLRLSLNASLKPEDLDRFAECLNPMIQKKAA